MKTNHNRNQIYIQHPIYGAITVSKFCPGNHPENKPWFCSARYYRTALSAVKGFIKEYNREQTPQEIWNERMSELNYQAGYAYACGYHD